MFADGDRTRVVAGEEAVDAERGERAGGIVREGERETRVRAEIDRVTGDGRGKVADAVQRCREIVKRSRGGDIDGGRRGRYRCRRGSA